MIYLDNAATTRTKPPAVAQAVLEALSSCGSCGRGAHEGALSAARTVYGTREKIAALLGCPRADHVCFTQNSTQALNIAISGLLGPSLPPPGAGNGGGLRPGGWPGTAGLRRF